MNNDVKSSYDKSLKKSSVYSYTTENNDNDSVFKSSSVVLYDNYYSLKRYIHSNKKLCNNIHYSVFRNNLDKWIEILFKTDYLKIICYLVKNNICHLRGFVKIFHEDSGNISKKINNLLKYGIIKSIDKEKFENVLYKHRKAFRIDDYHFNKAEVYQLTELGLKFYGNLDFTKSLHPLIIQQINNYTKELNKTNEKIQREIKTSKEFIDSIFPSYKEIVVDPKPEKKLIDIKVWLEGKVETLFRKTGVVLDSPVDEILLELNKRVNDKVEED
jgi:hypothetical protein